MASKTAEQMIRDAFQRAAGRGALVRWLDDAGAYVVDSSVDPDVAYVVRVDAGAFFCDCPSGPRPACWHRAAVAQLRASRAAFGLPADGPSAEQERAERVAAARDRLAAIERIFAA